MQADILKYSQADGRIITVTLKPNAFNLFEEPKNNLWTYDLEGRLIGMFVEGINYRRTLQNKFYQKTRNVIDGETYRDVQPVSNDTSEILLEQGKSILERTVKELPVKFTDVANKILSTDVKSLDANAENFLKLYLPVSILPPDQYLALVIQITEGCNFNRCLFCNFYKDREFRIKTPPEVERHIHNVRDFFGEGIKLRRSIFLADANAIITPQNRLVQMLRMIRISIPEINDIYSFIDVFTGLKKSSSDYRTLSELGVKRVYLGVESGSSALLEFLKKPQFTDDVLELTANLKDGGINIGLIFLAGAGGQSYHEMHLEDSVKLLEQIPLGKGDIVYVSEFYETNPEYRQVMERNNIQLPTRPQIRAMAKEFKMAVKSLAPRGVAVPIYDIQQFFY